MLKINKSEISITRGDTAKLNISVVNSNGDAYQLSSSDKLTLTVKKTFLSDKAVISKTVVGASTIKLNPSDTAGLAFGEYVYDVQLTNSSGDVYTIIPPSLFEVMPEVTI